MNTLPIEQATWFTEYCIPDWEHVPDRVRAFICEYVVPIWNACDTLFMYADAARVYKLACDMATAGGEGFVDMLLHVVATWTKTDVTSVAIHNHVSAYVVDEIDRAPIG